MTLHYEKFGDQGTPFILTHGLLESKINWRTTAKRLAQDYQVYALDLRNHGLSPHYSSMTYMDMAADIQAFVEHHELDDYVICGHSMGGKAAMVYALLRAANVPGRLRALIALDIAPVHYADIDYPYVAAMDAIDLDELESRAHADEQLRGVIAEPVTRMFLLNNLIQDESDFRWKINIPVLNRYMPIMVNFPDEVIAGRQLEIPALFLYGTQSDYVSETMYDKILGYFPEARIESLESGHNLHVEKRAEMIAVMENFLA